MSDEYIRKTDAIEAIGEEYVPRTDFERGMVSQLSCDKAKIKALSSADVVQVVHAHWKDNKNGTKDDLFFIGLYLGYLIGLIVSR